MTLLRGKIVELQIDTLRISQALRVSFKATKTLKPTPNTCDVSVFNLSPEHRALVTQAKTPTVSLRAGYKDALTSVFLGQAIHVEHARDGADVITTVSTSDGGDEMQKARVQVSFGPRAQVDQVLRALAKALGLREGNLSQVSAQVAGSLKANLYLGGVTLSGGAAREMTALVRSAGLEWSVQDGALQLLDQGKALAGFAVRLDESVLIGTPSVSNKNEVKGKTFLQGDFVPGRQIQIDHEFVKGAFRLEKCDYTGDTHTDDWSVDFEAKGPPP